MGGIPKAGVIPIFTSGIPNRAVVDAMRRSAPTIVMAKPPPRQNPLTAAITGLLTPAPKTSIPVNGMSRSSSFFRNSASSTMSSPVENTLAPPVRTIDRTSGSSSASRQYPANASRADMFSELFLSVRLSVMQAVLPFFSYSTSPAMALNPPFCPRTRVFASPERPSSPLSGRPWKTSCRRPGPRASARIRDRFPPRC
ncbi:MAG: hypothetical protein A4E73_03476 [Syntrophaceae bacterium PtaU1.Bin231]|nr:MAG: hypothetical protein A4E73_03476 [Syntrophaceae bacterium PtaU1.Bin231]